MAKIIKSNTLTFNTNVKKLRKIVVIAAILSLNLFCLNSFA